VALTEHAPDILKVIARLHPEGERIFDDSKRALARLREVAGGIDRATGRPVDPPPR
jgi:hypothetical protein